MLEKFNPLNWFSSESETEKDYQARPARAGYPERRHETRRYIYKINNESRIENPKSPIDAGEYRYAGVHEMSDPMYAYKAVEGGVARLIIPRGAKVVVPSSPAPLGRKKLRAGEVYVDKIINYIGISVTERDWDKSIRGEYEYHVGKKQIPRGGHLNLSVAIQCAAGLHFFLTAGQAIEYHIRNGNGAKMPKTEAVNAIKPDR